MSAPIAAGFARPAIESQAGFRAIMDAMAAPGRIVPLSTALAPPEPLMPAAAVVLLALCDFEVALHVAPAMSPAVAHYLRFHTGVQLTGSVGGADFVLLDDPGRLHLRSYQRGTPEFPDRGATIVIQARDLTNGAQLALHGPGIDGQATLAVAGLPAAFAADWAENRSHFPTGVDLIFVCGTELVALPRSTHVTMQAI